MRLHTITNMLCARVQGLVVRHSSFVVADCCCCRHFHATQYDMMISCTRVRYVVIAVLRRDVSSCACARGLVVVAVARPDMRMPCTCPRGLVVQHLLFVVAVVTVAVAAARRDTKIPCACARGLIVNIRHRHRHSCCCCRRRAT